MEIGLRVIDEDFKNGFIRGRGFGVIGGVYGGNFQLFYFLVEMYVVVFLFCKGLGLEILYIIRENV